MYEGSQDQYSISEFIARPNDWMDWIKIWTMGNMYVHMEQSSINK